MSSVKGHSLQFSMFGESHGPVIGMTIHNFVSGLVIDEKAIYRALRRRSTGGAFASQRQEADEVEWLSGTLNGVTTGAPLTFIIRNVDSRSKDYSGLKKLVRPSHADYSAAVKYDGFNDIRGGGMFSGRLTAVWVVAGTLLRQVMQESHCNISISATVSQLGSLKLPDQVQVVFDSKDNSLFADLAHAELSWYQRLTPEWRDLVQQVLAKVQSDGDSLGGRVVCTVEGIPAGIGNPHFYSVESEVASWLFGIPGVKAVSFGTGEAIGGLLGSQANDCPTIIDGHVGHVTNHNGGIVGGITNGMPIKVNVTFKPTPSIYKVQQTIDLVAMNNSELQISGRHDPAYVIRTPIIVESALAMAFADIMWPQITGQFKQNRRVNAL